MARLGGLQAEPWAIVAALSDRNPYVRSAAAYALRNVAEEANPSLGGPSTDPVANPEGQDAAANSLCAAAGANGISCAVVTQPGKHDWPFAAQAFAAALPWLASTLGTPYAEPVALPQRGGGAPH